MNENKADALLQWVNSVSGSDVRSLKDFAKEDKFEILVTVLQLIDKDCNKVIPNETAQSRILCVLDYLEGIYQDVNNFISSHSVVNGNELEIGKLISLLLCAAVQGNNVPYFVEKIHYLDNKVQYHLKTIIETMLGTEKGEINDKALCNLLQETAEDNPKDCSEHCFTQSPMYSPSVTNSPAETIFSNSPFVTLMLSPQMKNKQNQFLANKLHKQVKKLQMDLNLQQHLQSTLEDELAQKNSDIDAKSAKIREMQKELIQVKMAIDELESYKHFKNDFKKAEKEVNKLKEKIEKLEDYKLQYGNLEERTEKFLKEKELFDKQVEDNKLVRERLDRYKQQAHRFEFQVSELEAALQRREEEIETIIKQRDEALSAASETTELWRTRKQSDPEVDEEFHPLQDSLMIQEKIKPNQESRLIELEFENEKLKKQLTSSIDPIKLQQLQDRLDDVERSKKSYEEKYVNAKSEILSLKDNVTQLEGQSKIRQEALERKIEDTVNQLNDTRNKLDLSRKEVSRLQSELMVSRSEVEAHVIALEKQRITTSKAMDDMAAERKACEQEAAHKLYELRRELECKEKQALENSEKMNKAYDIKLREAAEEFQSINTKDRQELQLKLNQITTEKENLRTEFTSKENELQQAVMKAEKETVELRNEYENILADMKLELENEVKKSEQISQNLKQTIEFLEGKVLQIEKEKDEQHERQIAQIKKNTELEIKKLENEVKQKHDIAQQEIAKLKTEHEETLKRLDQEKCQLYESSKQERANRDKSIQELTDSFTKLKQETDATEARLLDITRERNEFEKALTAETKSANEKIETMSFQQEQLKAEHSKVIQEMLAAMQEERKNHKNEKLDMKNQLDKACHGLKVAADNIEEFKNTISELKQNVNTEKSKVKTLEDELEQLKEQSKEKQRKIYEEASKKCSTLQQAFDADRNTWKKKLDDALEENMTIRSEMFEKSQNHSAEVMEIRRLAQEKEYRASIEEKKLKDEIRQFIANLANERVSNNELKEKLQQTQDKFGKELHTKDKALHDVEERLKQLENKESELVLSLDNKDTLLNDKCREMEEKERTSQETLSRLKNEFEAEKEKMKKQMAEQLLEKAKESSELQHEIKSLRENLEKMTKDFSLEKESSAEEFQKKLQDRCNAQEKQAEVIDDLKKQIENFKDKNAKELEANKVEAEEKQEKLKLEIKELELKLEESSAPIKVLEDALKAVTEERDNMIDELKKAEVTWTNKESELNTKVCELEDECKIFKEKEHAVLRDEEEIQALTEHIEKLEQENTELEEALQEEKATCRRLGFQINSLSAEVDHAGRTIREQKQALEKMEFECDVVKKLTRNGLPTAPSSTSLSSSDTSTTSASLNDFSRSSLRSTIGGRVACNRRQSAIYLKRNTPPDKRTTAREAFFVLGDQFNDHLEALEEPFDAGYDWQRLEELERRNTICKPHMKTSYPIETQTQPDDNKNKTLMSSISDSGYRTGVKRNSGETVGNGAKDAKLRKDQPNSKSEGFLKRSKSKKLTASVSSKINSLRSRSKENVSKETKEESSNGNVAFSIDITPPNKKCKTTKTTPKEPQSLSKSKKESMAFTIENSPPKTKPNELKPKRQRTITRSTASSRLILEKDKEICKEDKKKQYLNKTNRKPLRNANKK